MYISAIWGALKQFQNFPGRTIGSRSKGQDAREGRAGEGEEAPWRFSKKPQSLSPALPLQLAKYVQAGKSKVDVYTETCDFKLNHELSIMTRWDYMFVDVHVMWRVHPLLNRLIVYEALTFAASTDSKMDTSCVAQKWSNHVAIII